MMNLSDDAEELEDFIRLDFADLQASENLQLLDPGIIDLGCDSEDECTSVKEAENFHGQPDLHSPVTTSHSKVYLKPMCIKVVDCYKFPWYFDKFKYIIEHKIANNQSVEVDDGILDDIPTDPSKELIDENNFVDMSFVDSVTMQRQAGDGRKEVEEFNKQIENIAAKESLENKKPITGAKSAKSVNNVRKKMDIDIRRAMDQRKNSVVDLKRNIGLVGMKILRLPNNIPTKLPVEISISKQLKKRTEANIEKGQGNKQKGPTSSSHVALDKVLMNETSTTPVFQETVEEMKDCVSTQNITENSTPQLLIRSIPALEEKETKSNDTPPLDQKCNIENELSWELSVNKIAEEIYRLVRPHTYVSNINQTIVSNSCNTLSTPTKATEENNKKMPKYLSQKYITEGTRTVKMIDPIPISPKKRSKDQRKSYLLTKATDIIDITDQMSPKSPSSKPEKSSSEANTSINKTLENLKDHKTKEMSSKHKPNTLAKPKIVLSTKKTNKLTETIIKIKEKQQKESSMIKPTKSLNPNCNTIPSSTLSNSCEDRSLYKQIDTNKNSDKLEKLLNEKDESKNIKSSSPQISLAQLQYSNRNNFVNAPNKDNHPQNTTDVSTDSDVLIKTPEKEAENVSENNYPESAQIVTESSMTVNCDESDNTSKNKSSQYTEKITVEVKLMDSNKEKLKQHYGTHRFPAVNPVETATNNFAIPTIVSNRETIISCTTKVDTGSNHSPKVTSPAVNTTARNNQSPVMTEPLTVYNSMQAHTLYKPSESSYQTFRQNQCNAVHFPSHIPQMNQPIYNYTGHSLQNTTHHATKMLPHIDTRPPSSGANEKILPLMFHRLPMPTLQPTNFGAPMLNGIRPNMPTRMRHPGPNGVFGAQMPSNPRPMSSFGVSSQIYRPQGNVPSQTPINYPQIPIGEMQSYDVLWSGPFSCMPPPPPPPLPTHLPVLQDISSSSPKLLPQSIDSSIIGRNITGIVKKINITAPVIKQKEEIDSKAEIIKIENSESDAPMPLYDKVPTDCFKNIEPVKTKKEMLRILDTGLQRVSSRIDVLTPADGIQKKAIQHSAISDRLNSKKEILLSQGKLDKPRNETTHDKNNSGTRKINSPVTNLIKVDRTPKEHQKNYKALIQKKENQHKSNHYLMNFIRKPKEKKDKKKEIHSKKCNESVRKSEHESDSIKISANQPSCIPKQIKQYEITKKPTSNHLKYIQDSKKGNKSIKLAAKSSKTTFEDLFGDGIDDADFEKVSSDKKSTGKLHSGLMNTEKTTEKSYESSVNLKRPANDEKPALSTKYRPGPLSKKKKLNDQEKVNPHQTNKKQILQSKTYSDPILPIPTYEKVLSNMPSYLCFRDDMKNSSVSSNFRYKKTSSSVNPKIPDPTNNKIEKEKERLKLDKAENIKKISLYEYKKRSTSERKVEHEAKDNYKKKHVEMHRRPSHADSDLGYDSDSTVKL